MKECFSLASQIRLVYIPSESGRGDRSFLQDREPFLLVGDGSCSREARDVTRLKKIYVGNLSFSLSDQDLMTIFAEHGEVASAAVVMDRETGRSRGFGFVEMENDEEANKAIQALNGKEVDGRSLNVNEARPREPRNNRPRW